MAVSSMLPKAMFVMAVTVCVLLSGSERAWIMCLALTRVPNGACGVSRCLCSEVSLGRLDFVLMMVLVVVWVRLGMRWVTPVHRLSEPLSSLLSRWCMLGDCVRWGAFGGILCGIGLRLTSVLVSPMLVPLLRVVRRIRVHTVIWLLVRFLTMRKCYSGWEWLSCLVRSPVMSVLSRVWCFGCGSS